MFEPSGEEIEVKILDKWLKSKVLNVSADGWIRLMTDGYPEYTLNCELHQFHLRNIVKKTKPEPAPKKRRGRPPKKK